MKETNRQWKSIFDTIPHQKRGEIIEKIGHLLIENDLSFEQAFAVLEEAKDRLRKVKIQFSIKALSQQLKRTDVFLRQMDLHLLEFQCDPEHYLGQLSPF